MTPGMRLATEVETKLDSVPWTEILASVLLPSWSVMFLLLCFTHYRTTYIRSLYLRREQHRIDSNHVQECCR